MGDLWVFSITKIQHSFGILIDYLDIFCESLDSTE